MALPYWSNDTKTKQNILCNQIHETIVVFWDIKNGPFLNSPFYCMVSYSGLYQPIVKSYLKSKKE